MEVNIPITRSIFIILGVFILLCSRFYIKLVTAASSNEMSRTKSLKDSETLVSENGMFKLGFFSPINSTDRYVGIWYNVNGSRSGSDTLEVVWVANKNNPIKDDDTSGVLKIENDFNLKIVSKKQNKTFWSSNGSISEVPKNSTPFAVLNDQGLLELVSEDNVTSYPIWTSTSFSTSLLPQITILINKYRNSHRENLILWSWKSASNPSIGSYFLRLIPIPFPEFVTEYVYSNSNGNSNRTYWRSGPWNGNQFIGVPSLTKEAGNGFRFMYDENEDLNFIFLASNLSLLEHYVLNYDGNILQKSWDYGRKKWLVMWQSMVSDCEYYGKCGSFGNCNAKKSPICSCLNGFEPKDKARWRKGDWSNGCVRKTPLRKCGDKEGKEDGFLRLKNRKVPDFAELLVVKGNENECRIKCLQNCWCLAYAYPKDVGCMLWSNRSLIDIQEFTSIGGADLFIRLAHSDLGENRNHKIIIIVVVIIIGTALLVFAYCVWSRKRQRKGHKSSNNQYLVRKEDFKDLIFFKFKELEVATNYFSDTNKLGRGGFGPVYKGKLEDGQEIAVKRLCSPSGQGLHEFMNEVVLISKLQHKNLVRLLGCCVQGEEKLLVYEYMSNKSLDALLFDSSLQKELDWKKRFEIINGICRGLLYLHRDSRYKIIHRDLKASNILLDEELNPKISDFGTARIVETKQDQTNTKRVVGTYGYMSPEYAMEGRFSEKSDVFSLGVLLLEIVSGKRITSHLIFESLNLLAYAWKLWTEKNKISLVDENIRDPSFESEMLKCIQLGLLCVQEFPEDRPTISALLYMLEVSDVMDLPHPTQPAFTHRNTCSTHNSQSINQITFTEFSGR